MMRKRNNMRNNGGGQQGRNNGGGHNNGGQRRYHTNNGGGNRGGSDSGNLQRQKHHATQQREKFMNMARDAQNNGDRVDVEYYMQHVEHYSRVLTDIAVVEAERFSHPREPQVQHPQEQQDAPGDGNHAAAGDESAPQGDGNHQQQPVDMNGNQPRMTHRPRQQRSHYSPPLEERQNAGGYADAANQQADADAGNGNGGGNGGNGNGEIPLPGSIISAI